jgi:PAS domain S-box-containing protein
VVATLAALLREQLGPLPWQEDAAARIALGLIAFSGVGLFVAEVVRTRRTEAESIRSLQKENALRREAEEDARALVESSPAAIVTVGPDGRIDLTNDAAKEMLGLESKPAAGQDVGDFFPVLGNLMKSKHVGPTLASMIETSGRRRNGEMFFAQMWLSLFRTPAGMRLTAVITDASEQLRDREELGLRQLLMNSRIIAGAVSHEIRNLAAAAEALHGRVGTAQGVAADEDFQALGKLILALRKLASAEVPTDAERSLTGVDVSALLRELRIILNSSNQGSNLKMTWEVGDNLPRVRADHSGLLQVLLNLTQNSIRALGEQAGQRITVTAYQSNESVVIRVADNGPGVPAAENLFQPFQPGATSAGLGLYVSRAIVRTYGGELQYRRGRAESIFVIELPAAAAGISASV